MPTRLIREGILTSDRVNKLSADAEVFYRRLLSKVDDHGLFDARPAILVAGLYPLRIRETTENNCLQLLAECMRARLVDIYGINGKIYGQVLNTQWKTRSEPKFPLPINGASMYNCEQLFTTVSLDVVVVEVVDKPKPSCASRAPRASLTGRGVPGFGQFWATYPRKKSKGQAEKAWLKLKPDEQLTARIIAAAERAKTSDDWQRDGGKYIPYPASWLNARGWEDEIPAPKPKRLII